MAALRLRPFSYHGEATFPTLRTPHDTHATALQSPRFGTSGGDDAGDRRRGVQQEFRNGQQDAHTSINERLEFLRSYNFQASMYPPSPRPTAHAFAVGDDGDNKKGSGTHLEETPFPFSNTSTTAETLPGGGIREEEDPGGEVATSSAEQLPSSSSPSPLAREIDALKSLIGKFMSEIALNANQRQRDAPTPSRLTTVESQASSSMPYRRRLYPPPPAPRRRYDGKPEERLGSPTAFVLPTTETDDVPTIQKKKNNDEVPKRPPPVVTETAVATDAAASDAQSEDNAGGGGGLASRDPTATSDAGDSRVSSSSEAHTFPITTGDADDGDAVTTLSINGRRFSLRLLPTTSSHGSTLSAGSEDASTGAREGDVDVRQRLEDEVRRYVTVALRCTNQD